MISITLVWHAALLFATVVMGMRQCALFFIGHALLCRGGAWKPSLRWWVHFTTTAALITATIMVFA